jgi:RNA polymerase sigma-70 factor (ECF subfamily)
MEGGLSFCGARTNLCALVDSRPVVRPAPASPRESPRADRLSLATDERDLVAAIRNGDTAAFEALFREYFAPLAAHAMGLIRSPLDAEAIAQDVLVRIWDRRDHWEVRGSLRGYLYAAVRNRALDDLKRGRAAVCRIDAAAREGGTPGLAEDAAGREADRAVRARDLEAALAVAIERLPERCRQAYLLRWQHGLTRSEAAAALGISVKAVEAQMTRALKSLREALSEFL